MDASPGILPPGALSFLSFTITRRRRRFHHAMFAAGGRFPATRLRRSRRFAWSRALVRESELAPAHLILPLFVKEGEASEAVSAMPGVERLSLAALVERCGRARASGIGAVALFPAIDHGLKDERGSEAVNPDNLLCRAVAAVKRAHPALGVIADAALDPFTSHGQDGILKNGVILNDETVAQLSAQAVVQAQAGCDVIAPSDMMDGRIKALRLALDEAGFSHVMLLSYAAKYASAFYGPFREAVGSAAALGAADKKSYQMDPANAVEALREILLDVEEGADMVMVKPGLPCLDIIRLARAHFPVPVFAYQVSGEYAMLKAASANGWLDYRGALMESLTALKRAGASGIFTYAALDAARFLKEP